MSEMHDIHEKCNRCDCDDYDMSVLQATPAPWSTIKRTDERRSAGDFSCVTLAFMYTKLQPLLQNHMIQNVSLYAIHLKTTGHPLNGYLSANN